MDAIVAIIGALLSLFFDAAGIFFSCAIVLANNAGGLLVLVVCAWFVVASVGRVFGGIWWR